MSVVLSIAAFIVVLVVGVWVAVFGGIGAVLAPRRGRTAMSGFLLGALLGPIGWLIVIFKPGSAVARPKRAPRRSGLDRSVIVPSKLSTEDGDDELPIH